MSKLLIFLNKNKNNLKHSKNKSFGANRSFAQSSWATWANRSFAQSSWVTWANRSRLLICMSDLRDLLTVAQCSFVLSDMNNSLTVAHLSWASWANPSQSLIWFERNERWAKEQIPSPELQYIDVSRKHNFRISNFYNFIRFSKFEKFRISGTVHSVYTIHCIVYVQYTGITKLRKCFERQRFTESFYRDARTNDH